MLVNLYGIYESWLVALTADELAKCLDGCWPSLMREH